MNEEDLKKNPELEEVPAEGPLAVGETEIEEETPKGRKALRKRYAEKYPDEDFDALDDDALADRVMSDFDDKNGRIAKHEENDKKLTDLFDKNPQSASFLMGMANGEDFLSNLYKNFGADIVEAMQDPDKQDDLKKANQEYLDKIAEDKKLQEEYETNLEETLQRLQEEQEANGMTDEEIAKGMDGLTKVVDEFFRGKISTDTIRMFLKAENYDGDVEAARRSGEVAGRNANITEKLRKRSAETDGMPSLGGQSNRNAQGQRIDRDHLRGANTGTNIWKAGNIQRHNYE